jgi:hypothetical protein
MMAGELLPTAPDAVPTAAPPVVPSVVAAPPPATAAPAPPDDPLVPVMIDGQPGTVPRSQLAQTLAYGGEAMSQDDYAKAVLQAKYGDLKNTLQAAGEGAARGATLGLSDVVARAVGGKNAVEEMRRRKVADPYAAGLGEVGGFTAGSLLGADELSALGRGGEAAGTVLEALGSPARLMGGVGDAVEAGVAKMLPGEATSLAGRLATHAVTSGARGAAEMGIMNGGDAISEAALEPDPNLTADRLLSAVGHGMLLGAVGGGILGASGELGRDLLGRIAPHVADLAETQAFRALDSRKAFVKEAERVPGGTAGVGRELLDSGLVSAGDSVEEMAPKVAAAREEAGAKLGEMHQSADSQGFAGPKLANINEDLRKAGGVVDRLEQLPSMNEGAIKRVQSLWEDIQRSAGLPTLEEAQAAGMLAGLHPSAAPAALREMQQNARLTFEQAQQLRARIDDAIKWTTNPLAPKNELTEALKAVRGSIESEIERAGDEASEKVGGDFLRNYQDAKLKFRRLAVADNAVADSLSRRTANRALSPSDYGIGGLAGVAGAMAHGPIGVIAGLASAAAHHVLRERGNATAAVALDKISALAGLRKAASRVERETERAAMRAAGKEERALPRLKPRAFEGDFEAKRKAVIDAATNMDAHIQDVAAATSSFAPHAPNVAKAFQLSALKATNYLVNALPKPRESQNSVITPQLMQHKPTSIEAASFTRKFDAVHDPVSVLHGVAQGTVTLDEMQALQATHGPWLADARQQVKDHLLDRTEPLPYQQRIAISKFLGEPADPTMDPKFIAAQQARYQGRGASKPGGGGGRGGSRPKATPKANDLSFADNASLSSSERRT